MLWLGLHNFKYAVSASVGFTIARSGQKFFVGDLLMVSRVILF
jgi:hypothetical protein